MAIVHLKKKKKSTASGPTDETFHIHLTSDSVGEERGNVNVNVKGGRKKKKSCTWKG